MAPLPSARSRYKAGPDLQHGFIHPKGAVVNLQKKCMETHFPCAVCKLWCCPVWVSWSTQNHCLRTGVAPSATEAGFALPCVTQGTGWMLPRKAAEATVLVPLGPPVLYSPLCPRGITGLSGWGCTDTKGPKGACQESNSQPCNPAGTSVNSSTLLLWFGLGTHRASHQCRHCWVKHQGKWHKAFTVMSVPSR